MQILEEVIRSYKNSENSSSEVLKRMRQFKKSLSRKRVTEELNTLNWLEPRYINWAEERYRAPFIVLAVSYTDLITEELTRMPMLSRLVQALSPVSNATTDERCRDDSA